MNALKVYNTRIELIAARFEEVTNRRLNELTGDARENFSAELGLHYFKRRVWPHQVTDFVQCEIVVGVLS